MVRHPKCVVDVLVFDSAAHNGKKQRSGHEPQNCGHNPDRVDIICAGLFHVLHRSPKVQLSEARQEQKPGRHKPNHNQNSPYDVHRAVKGGPPIGYSERAHLTDRCYVHEDAVANISIGAVADPAHAFGGVCCAVLYGNVGSGLLEQHRMGSPWHRFNAIDALGSADGHKRELYSAALDRKVPRVVLRCFR